MQHLAMNTRIGASSLEFKLFPLQHNYTGTFLQPPYHSYYYYY